MKRFFALFLFVAVFLQSQALLAAPAVHHFLRMPEPHTHYFEVETRLSKVKTGKVDVKMATWTPGSYLIREYAQHVERFIAFDQRGKAIPSQKINKNTWRIENGNNTEISYKYYVYSYEHSVRTNFLDASHGYLNPAAVFTWVDGHQQAPITLTIEPYKEWETISTGLYLKDPEKANTFYSPNYDVLADSPIEIGNHDVLEFEAEGIPHKIAMYGIEEYPKEQIIADFTKIAEVQTKIFQEHPCKKGVGKDKLDYRDYTYIAHHVNSGYGGLEHLNSTSVITSRNTYESETAYLRYLGLISHEYFHLWNVRRIRPQPLMDIDYEKENYTDLLWVAEGFTSYYDDLTLYRAGLMDEAEYLAKVAANINRGESVMGKNVQSLRQASFDAWIKFYRPNENSANSTVSYYVKGAVISTLLDIELLAATKGKKGLDEVLRILYKDYYKKGKGYTYEDIIQVSEQVAGQQLDDFFAQYVDGTAPIDYNASFTKVGMEAKDLNQSIEKAYFGALVLDINGKWMVKRLVRDQAAYKAGINVDDEIISLNGERVENFADAVGKYKQGEQVEVRLARDGKLHTITVVLGKNPTPNYVLQPQATPEKDALELRKAWLGQ